jgi:hypothetical protein
VRPGRITRECGEQSGEEGRRYAGRGAQVRQEYGHALAFIEEGADDVFWLRLGECRRKGPERQAGVTLGVGDQRPEDRHPEPEPAQTVLVCKLPSRLQVPLCLLQQGAVTGDPAPERPGLAPG